MSKPWDDPGEMFGKLYKMSFRWFIKDPNKITIRINGQTIRIDRLQTSNDSVIITDGNKTISFHRAERDWINTARIPRKARGKWAVSSVNTTVTNY